MRILTAFLGLLILVSCQPKKKSTPPPPSVDERIGIYKQATAYAAATDYEFEINGKPILVRVSSLDSLLLANVPSNLIVPSAEGPEGANPLLIGTKYKLIFGPQEHLKSIRLMGNHDPADPELPAIPEVYSGLLGNDSKTANRVYLNLSSDLTALLLIDYEENKPTKFKHGRWTRTYNGQQVSAQLGQQNWQFLVKENALVLVSQQLGKDGMTLMASTKYDLCHYVHNWLSDVSTTDGESKVFPENITNQTPLSDILRTEHAYMNIYGELELVFNVTEDNISRVLRKNPTVQGVCDLVMQVSESGH